MKECSRNACEAGEAGGTDLLLSPRPPLFYFCFCRRPCSGVAIRDDVVIASYLDGSLRAFRLTFPAPVTEVFAHVRAVTSLACHPVEPLVRAARSMMVGLARAESSISQRLLPLLMTFLQVASVGEDGMVTVWRIGGEDTLSLVFSEEVTDHMLTGVAFTQRGPPHVMVSAYDVTYLRLFCAQRDS